MSRPIVSLVMLAVCAGFFVAAPVYAAMMQSYTNKEFGFALKPQTGKRISVEKVGSTMFIITTNGGKTGQKIDVLSISALPKKETTKSKNTLKSSKSKIGYTYLGENNLYYFGGGSIQGGAGFPSWISKGYKKYGVGKTLGFSTFNGAPPKDIKKKGVTDSATSKSTAPVDFSVISLALDTKDSDGIKGEIVFSAPAKNVAITIKEKNTSELLFGMKFTHVSGQKRFPFPSIVAGLMPNQTYVFQVHGVDQKTGRLTVTTERQFTTGDYPAFFLGRMPYHEPVQTDVHGLVIRRRTWDDGVRWQYRLYTPVSKQVAVRLNGSTVQMHQVSDLTRSEEKWETVPVETTNDVLSLYLAPNSDTLLVIDQKNQLPLTFTALP
ncbi:hypothetical protein HY627_00280 [Candidatus Uhrbacteria bacterium]|nr:hypothetical protein [Candidatus Uhrbacteria bacterium]